MAGQSLLASAILAWTALHQVSEYSYELLVGRQRYSSVKYTFWLYPLHEYVSCMIIYEAVT